jgi:hypothetical protein
MHGKIAIKERKKYCSKFGVIVFLPDAKKLNLKFGLEAESGTCADIACHASDNFC